MGASLVDINNSGSAMWKESYKKKKRISKLSCQSLQLGENYTEIKA